MTFQPIGADRLAQIATELSSSDLAVLRRLEQHRFLQSDQLARFEFRERPTRIAALRAAHRCLKKLRTLGAVAMLDRTIGGVKRGSSAAVWTLTNTGLRLNALGDDRPRKRRREADPSLVFLKHEVAVAELHLTQVETVAASGLNLTRLELEPACWRRYLGPLGSLLTLKPDLASSIESESFESAFFWEVDLATEPPRRVLAKCLQYQEYYRSGDELRRTGFLPLVVWVVPAEARRHQLARHLTPENGVDERLFRLLIQAEVSAFLASDENLGRLPGG